nr:retrovirus-related Pol polyprotein from transposon TNT 1-94 [Tanacetum cinerariifolium]
MKRYSYHELTKHVLKIKIRISQRGHVGLHIFENGIVFLHIVGELIGSHNLRLRNRGLMNRSLDDGFLDSCFGYGSSDFDCFVLSSFGSRSPLFVKIVIFIIDSGCSKHMAGNLKLLINFVEKFLGTGNDLLTGSRGTDLYSITLQDTNSPNLIFLMAKTTSSQAWLWHGRLSHLNFDTINLMSKNDIVVGLPKLKFVKDHLCSSCELGKAKQKSFHTKITPSSKRRLQLLHMDFCGPMRVASINGKRCVLVIIDDYSRYTWTYFLRSKDETPEVLIDFLRLVQRGLQAQVRIVRTDKGNGYYKKDKIQAKPEKTKHKTESVEKPKVNQSQQKVNPDKVKATKSSIQKKYNFRD